MVKQPAGGMYALQPPGTRTVGFPQVGVAIGIQSLFIGNDLQGNHLVLKLVPAVGIIILAVWGLGPLMRQSRNLFFHKSDSSWRKSRTHYIMTSHLQPLLRWTGATLICRCY